MKKILIVILICVITIVTFSFSLTANAASATSVAGRVSTNSSSLNVRSAAWATSSVLTSVPKGSYITLISQTGSWWYVEYANGKYGYCHSNYIDKISSSYAANVSVSSGNLNVRLGAGTSYAITGSLARGKTVIVLSSASGWSKIVYNGTKTGYVSSKYLVAASSSSGISLAVPSFKQTDSRWANVYIGSSGQTIAKIGCATTAVAMLESYRQGKTIYPDAMSKQLSYSSSGSLYWPSYYTQITNGENYLYKISTLLNQGKPVILGAKNSYGGQHWVVVTGYSGNSSNTASYMVNDPGSNSRTTLSQFLAVYPNFYKIIHY